MAESTQNNPKSSTENQQNKESKAIEARRPASPLTRSGGFGESPFSFVRRFINDMDRLFGDFGPSLGEPLSSYRGESLGRGAWIPQIDVFERDGRLIVHADLPGLRQNDVRVNVDQGVLTISGERQHTHEHEKGGVYHCERSYGSFQRAIALPDGVDPESIQATFENGVLEVTMPAPKEAQTKGRAIPIGAKPQGTGVKH